MAIADWPIDERPREKLLERGPEALSDAELVAILFRTGIRGRTAVDLARAALKQCGSLSALLTASREAFQLTAGLGDAKYAQLQAVLEMSRRALVTGAAVRALPDHAAGHRVGGAPQLARPRRRVDLGDSSS